MISKTSDEELMFMVAKRLNVSPTEAERIVHAVSGSIRDCLVENETVHVKKFGMLFLKKKKPTRQKNFNKETIMQDCWMIRYHPSSSMRDLVNQNMRKKTAEAIESKKDQPTK